MSLLQSLRDIFCTPQGPTYDLEDLVFNDKEYLDHVEAAYQNLQSLLWGHKYAYIVDATDDDPDFTELLARVHYTYTDTIQSWTQGEFISKIKQYVRSKYRPPVISTIHTHVKNNVSVNMPLLSCAIAHLEAARNHGKEVVAAIRFFTCDTRSPFDKTASLRNGDCSARELCDWYIGGLNIIKKNMAIIDDNLSTVIDFIRRNKK